MAKSPYPGYQPSFTKVEETGGFHRTCVVIEFLTLDKMNTTELARILENLEYSISKLKTNMGNMESFEVVTPDRFDPILKTGLRL